jgi:peptidoglycan DL-endopeptidase CwlO
MRAPMIALAAGAVLITPIAGGSLIGATVLTSAAGACGPAGPARQVAGLQLDAEQLANAGVIIDVTHQAGLPARAAVIAVATALQESTLRNLDHGDTAGPDSRGLFQQRIRYYGVDVATDPARSTTAFLALLVQVPGWDTIPLTVAAATVQRPRADLRGAYAKWETAATRLVAGTWPAPMTGPPAPSTPSGPAPLPAPTSTCGLGGEGLPGAGGGALPPGYRLPTAGQGAIAVRAALSQLGKPYIWGGVGPDGFDCSGLTMTSWAAAGVAIPRTAHEQAGFGLPVTSVAALQPGDLLFIAGSHGTATSPGHLGMYIGTVDGIPYLVQARQTGTDVEVDPFSRWEGLIVGIRRPITR